MNSKTQLKTIFQFLQNNIATASMVSKATGVPKKCICRFKRDLEQKGLLREIEKQVCQITGFKAWYLTTRPEFVNSDMKLQKIRKEQGNNGNSRGENYTNFI